jgi:hypothetical protein
MIPVGALDGGDQPSVPGTPTATNGQNATSTITFTPSAYIGKGTVSYEVTSSPGGLVRTGSSPLEFSGLTNGVTYTFTVKALTNYGVYSETSGISNAITPVQPAPPNPCLGCPAAGTLLGSRCIGYTLVYDYADGCCGVGSSVVIEYNSGTCGYQPPAPQPVYCDTCHYPVTGQTTFTCGCVELPSGYRQKYFIRTYFSPYCTPDGCLICSCPTTNDSPCTLSGSPCIE